MNAPSNPTQNPTQNAPLNARWSHVGLNCRDQDATEAFYTRWFGFRRARVIDDGRVRVIFIRSGEVLLELFDSAVTPAPRAGNAGNDGPAVPGIIRHLAFQVDDLDRFLAEAAGAVPISLGPLSFDSAVPGWRTVWVNDPDGVVVEVSQGYADQSPAELVRYADRPVPYGTA